MNSNIREKTNTLIDNELNGYTGGGAYGGISSFSLKLIALATMLVDHLAAVLLATYINNTAFADQETADAFTAIYDLLRGVGRMAFPLFVFALIKGFMHTSSKGKYATRLFLFALISEVPFDLAFYRDPFYFKSQNVFWTLFLGLITICLLDWIKNAAKILDTSKSIFNWIVVNMIRCIGITTIILGSMALAEFGLKCDYGAGGIAAIVVMYFLRDYRKCGFIAAVVLLGYIVDYSELWALLMVIPVHLYNGTKGPKNQRGIYLFYPVHLLIIALINIYWFIPFLIK